MKGAHPHFHITQFDANDIWPRGGWSLYQITGDDIAKRIAFGPDGRTAVRRDSWPGFIGCFETLDDVMEAVAAAPGVKTYAKT